MAAGSGTHGNQAVHIYFHNFTIFCRNNTDAENCIRNGGKGFGKVVARHKICHNVPVSALDDDIYAMAAAVRAAGEVDTE